MRASILIILCFLVAVAPAKAADDQPEKTDDKEWTIGFSGGTTMIEGGSDQTFGSLSISKDFGDSYAGVAVTYVDSGDVPGLINSIPASTTEISLSAGTNFDALSLDGYVSFGKRDFAVEALQRNGQTATISSDGDAFGIGGSLSYDLALNENLFLSPSISVDYNELDIVRVAQSPAGGTQAIENKEDGLTGTFGLALQQIFGASDDHVASLIGNIVTTSNTTSFNPGTSQSAVLRALATRDEPGQKDSWGEAGIALSFGLNEQLRLDFSVLQTIGFLNSDATSLSAGLRYSF